jgi:hypothetical protein
VSDPQSGETVYRPPTGHVCEPYSSKLPVGSVWKCGECGIWWRYHYVGLVLAAGWRPMGRLEVWWWRRRHAS